MAIAELGNRFHSRTEGFNADSSFNEISVDFISGCQFWLGCYFKQKSENESTACCECTE